jgi:regulator of sirC expression with transglutaminase-like and TPR domain
LAGYLHPQWLSRSVLKRRGEGRLGTKKLVMGVNNERSLRPRRGLTALEHAMTAKAVLVCAVAAGVMGCTRSSTQRPPGPIVSALFAVDAEFGSDPETTARAFTSLQDIAARVEQRRRHTRTDVADDINAVVFGELGFEREIESTASRFFRLSSVLGDRRGSCLGLGALYLAIGERIGIPLDGILLPGHFFVRTRGPASHNVELLRRGEAMPDEWYRKKYGPWPETRSAYFRPVTVSELGAIHWYNRGNELRAAGNLGAAEQAFARAAQEFPGFAEAHASLGAAKQQRGAFAEAEASYRAAARAWPDLPGLAHNLEILRAQREQDAPARR